MRKGRLSRRIYRAVSGRLPSLLRSTRTGKLISLETSQKLPHAQQYIDYSFPLPSRKARKEAFVDIFHEIRGVNPRAKIILLPSGKRMLYQDMRVENISAGQALELTDVLSAHGVTPNLHILNPPQENIKPRKAALRR
jgi:hypothetical protein